MMEGIIYKVTNIKNGDVYIGATKCTLNKRKSDHVSKANNRQGHQFHDAISTFGAEAFKWEQIDTANSADELATKEKEYIVKYNSKETGYNSDGGGGIKKTIYRYSIVDGSLISTYDSLEHAGNAINASVKAISKTCLSINQVLGGYYWSYNYTEPFVPNSDKRKKEVHQYDLDGNFIAQYVSASEASRQTEVNKTSIAKVCRGERNKAGGYIWVYK